MKVQTKKMLIAAGVFLVLVVALAFLLFRAGDAPGGQSGGAGTFPTPGLGDSFSRGTGQVGDGGRLFPSGETEEPGLFYTIDTDGDGIPDWREILLGLNPNKKDTDGDGIPDDEEETSHPSAGSSFFSSFDPSFIPPLEPPVYGESLPIMPSAESVSAKNTPRIATISPTFGTTATTITISGDRFEPFNTVYTGFGVVKNVPSPDGKTIMVSMSAATSALSTPPEGKVPVLNGNTLTFRDAADGDKAAHDPTTGDGSFVISIPVVVQTKYGLSNPQYFKTTLKFY